ncbi:MAG: hypothetical protein IPL78_21120 [Chloroflexi bacterium]|nr:hypothetical protein [Chloroflexota bacterium]
MDEHDLNNITQTAILNLGITTPITQKRIKDGNLHLLLSDGTHLTWPIPTNMLPTAPKPIPTPAKPKRGKAK